MAEPRAYLNGRFVPASQAMIPVYDAGFVLGATVSEQLRTFGGKLFRLAEHLERLWGSLEIVGVDPGMARPALAEVAERLAAENHALLEAGDDLGVSIFVTPGPYATLAPAGASGPTIGIHTYPLPFANWADKYERGERLVLAEIEQVSDRSWPRRLKCRSRMHYYLAERQAGQAMPGGRALLADAQGHVLETSTSNLLIYERRAGLVSPLRESVLPGISLDAVCQWAAELDLPFQERPLTEADVSGADEVLLASTPSCLLPVTEFQGRPIGSGVPGEVFRRLLARWSDAVQVDIAGQACRFAARGQP
jgi:branched-subunit amino acid aminotransferase/4-amino-4-deoxychorismate lyase